MRQLTTITLTLLLAICGGCSIFLDDRSRGIYDANKRLRNGEYVQWIPTGALLGEESFRYYEILQKEHGIVHEMIFGQSREYLDGFNSVMSPELEKRFDDQLREEAYKRAVAEFIAEEGRAPSI